MSAIRMTQMTAVATALAMLAFPALAETMQYKADLTAAAEVPPTDSTASGSAEVTVDTDAKTVSWTVTTQDLTGDAIGAHIHGPAGETETAGPVITFDPIMEGSGPITDEQVSDIEAGKTYVNVHTDKFPDGEIRGQLMKAE